MKQSLWVQSVWSWILSDLRFPKIFQVKPTFPDFLRWKFLRENWECSCYRHSEWRTGVYKQCASYFWLCWLCNDRGKRQQWKWEKGHFYECVKINYLLPLASLSWLCWLSMIEDKINNEIHCWNCLLSILCSFWNETDFPLWVSKFQAQGTRWHCLSCFDILFLQSRSNSEAFVLKLQSGSSGILDTPPLPPPLHILCFPKALLIWILDVIKKSSWKHPIHLKFRFIWIFSQETLVECMPRDPKECKAFKLYIQALRSLADRWHTATR